MEVSTSIKNINGNAFSKS